MTVYLLAFVFYIVILFVLSFYAYKNTQSMSDYILGGRKLGRWVSALSSGSSDMSGWLLLGLPGYAYLSGLEAIWIAIGLLIGASLNWIFIASRLRQRTEQAQNALTIPEFLEHHFDDRTHFLRFISAMFILIFYLFYTTAGLVAAGKLFESVLQLPYHYSVFLGAIIVLLYTAFGGFLAVSWTDLFQGLLMFFALLMVVALAQSEFGSLSAFHDRIVESNQFLLDPFTDSAGKSLSLISIISLLSWGLGYFGQPHILSRFMAIKSIHAIPAARNIAITWTGLCLTFSVLIGLYGVAILNVTLNDTQSETVLLELLPVLFYPVFAAIVLTAILAAIMSTADSQLLVAASVFTEDVVKTLLPKYATDKQLILFGRITVIIIALIASFLALEPDNKILDLVAYAWAGFGAAFGPLLILILYTKSVTRIGALTGIVSGGLTVIVWKQLEGGWFDLYELFPAFVLSFLSILLVSRHDKQRY